MEQLHQKDNWNQRFQPGNRELSIREQYQVEQASLDSNQNLDNSMKDIGIS